jgi:uncharacterized protein YxeA
MDKEIFLFVSVFIIVAVLHTSSLAAVDPPGRTVWVDGPSAGDTAGSYAVNGPLDARKLASSWTGADDSLFIFGGEGASGSLFCDLWKKTPTGQWTPLTSYGTHTVNAAGVYPATVGACGSSCRPGCRKDAATWKDPATGIFYLFGGWGYDSAGTAGLLNDVWSFQPTAPSWSWLSGSKFTNANVTYHTLGAISAQNNPGGRFAAAAAAKNGQLWLHGGIALSYITVPDPAPPVTPPTAAPVAAPVAEPVEAPVEAPAATPIAEPVAVPVEISPEVAKRDVNEDDGVSFEDQEDQTAILARDMLLTYSELSPLADTWYFDIASGQWYLVEQTSATATQHGAVGSPSSLNNPGARYGHMAYFSGESFWVFGGFGHDTSDQKGFLNDVMSFDITQNNWVYWLGSSSANASGSAAYPSARLDAAGWTGTSGSFWLVGGMGTDGAGLQDAHLGDIWSFNPTTRVFTMVGGSTSGSLETCSGGGAGCGLTPSYGSIRVSSPSNRLGPRHGASTFHQKQSNQGLIFGGKGFDVSNTLHLMQDTWTVQSVPPTPTLDVIASPPALTAASVNGHLFALTGTFFGYNPAQTLLTLGLGLGSCVPSATGFSTTTLQCTPTTTATSSGNLIATFTSEWGAVSANRIIAVVAPVLNSGSAPFHAAAFTAFTINGLGFGSSASPLSVTVTFSDATTTMSCVPGSVTPTSFVCTPQLSTVSVSGPFTAVVTYNDGSVTPSSSSVRQGSIVPRLAAVSEPYPSATAVTVPTSYTIAGFGFGNTASALSVTISFAGTTGRSCVVQQAGLTPTSLVCTLANTANVPAGTYEATVTVTVSAEPFVSNTRIIGVITPTIDTIASLPVYSNDAVPSSITIAGHGFGAQGEMSVSLSFPGGSVVTCTPTAASLTSVTCTNPVTTSPAAGIVNATVTRTYNAVAYSSQSRSIFRVGARIDASPIHILASATTLTVTGSGLDLSPTLVLSASISSAIPTCSITSTSNTQVVCTLSAPFIESVDYDITISDPSGRTVTASGILVVHPTATVPQSAVFDAIAGTVIAVSGFGFGPTGTALGVSLTNGATCAAVTAINPTSFSCTLASPAQTAGAFSMQISVNSRYSPALSYGSFRPTLRAMTTIFQSSTPIVLTIQGAAFLGTSGGSLTITGHGCGVANTCPCAINAGSVTGTSFTCNLASSRSSGTMTGALQVGSYAISTAVVGFLQPVVTPSTANLVSTATSVSLQGFGFGKVTTNVVVTLNTGACSVTAVNINTMTCTFTTQPTPGMAITAILAINDAPLSVVAQIATCISPPFITPQAPLPKLSIGATQLMIQGANFGTNPLGVSITLSPSGTCTVSTTTATLITCNVQSGTLPAVGTTLSVTITKDGGSNLTPEPIYVIVALPVVTKVTTAIVKTSTTVTIGGSNFGAILGDVSVALSLNAVGVPCANLALISTTSLQCTIDGGFSDVGPLMAVVTVAGGSSNSVQVATIANRPTISELQGDLALSATSVTITGTGFTQNGAILPMVASITFSSTSGPTPVCTTLTVTSSTTLTCALSGGPFSAGTMSVTAFSVNGLSIASASLPVSLYNLRDLPYVIQKTSPAIQLGQPSSLVITGTRFAGSSISVVVRENGVDIVGYCPSPIFSTSGGTEILTCPSRVWNVAGSITALVTSSGLTAAGYEVVGVVRSPPVITPNLAKLGSKQTTLSISGTNFSPFSSSEYAVSVTGGSSGTLPVNVDAILSFSTTGISIRFPNTLPTGAMFAYITVAGIASASPVQIATVVVEPSATTRTRSVPLNSTSILITGTGLAFDSTAVIAMENALGTEFPCTSVTPVNASALRCIFVSGQLSLGSVLVKSMILDGVASLINRITVAVALPIPTITENPQVLTLAESITIEGHNFSTVYPMVVTLSSGTCTVTSLSASSVTCSMASSSIDAGPLTAVVTIGNGVTSPTTVIARIRPEVSPFTSRAPITRRSLTITGSHFSPVLSRNQVTLTTSLNGYTQDCTVTAATRTSIRCDASSQLYVGGIQASVNVTGSDGSGYVSDEQRVATLTPVLSTEPIFANVSSGGITFYGEGFEGTNLFVGLYNTPQATGLGLECLINESTWSSVTCWPDHTPVGGVYTAVISVDTGSGLELTPPISALAIAPLITEDLIGERRTLLALDTISTDSKTLVFKGTGFDTNPTRNLVRLSSGLCDVVEATSTNLTCTLKNISPGTLSARVTTNSVASPGWTPVALVTMGSPIDPLGPTNRPSWNSSTVDDGAGPTANRKSGFTNGAIAGIVIACIFGLALVVIIILAYFVFKRDTGETANRLLKATRKKQRRSARSRSSKASRSASMNGGGSKGSSKRPKEAANGMSPEEDEFIRRIIFAGGNAAGDENGDFLFDSSSEEYLYRSSSDTGDGEESPEYSDTDETSISGDEVDDSNLGSDQDQDGPSINADGPEEAEEEEYLYTSSEDNTVSMAPVKGKSKKAASSSSSVAESVESKSSEYLYTSGSDDSEEN